MALWFDLSPMRPDEWANSDAKRWQTNVMIRRAYMDGAAEANDDHQAREDLKKGPTE